MTPQSPGTRTVDLTVVVVNWNVRDLLRCCLASIDNSHLSLETFVVDNGSSDGSLQMVRDEFPKVRLIANQDNLGFTAANNQALAQSQGRYLVLLNPDAELVGDALGQMVAYLESHPDVGVLGPQLRYPDDTVQSSRRRFPTLATAFAESTIIQQWWPDNGILRRYYVSDNPENITQPVDWVMGACMMVRREAYEQVGGLDEGFFMYSEELDWCRRIKDAGWGVFYLPAAVVIHHEGKSSEQVVPERHIHFQSSKVRYFRKHHGRWQAGLLRWFLLVTYVYQLVREGLKWLVGHNRPLRASRVQAYRRVLGSGLRDSP